jgi:hypothetical protein
VINIVKAKAIDVQIKKCFGSKIKELLHRLEFLIPTQRIKGIVIDPVHLKEVDHCDQSYSSQTSLSSGSHPNVNIVTQKAMFLLVFEEISSATFQLLAAYYLGKEFANVLTYSKKCKDCT